jgi:hypothetical protein
MDINGAKALKKRLEQSGMDEASPAPSDVEVPEDAPPVFHWFGVGREGPHDAEDEGLPAAGVSLFSRLGLSLR